MFVCACAHTVACVCVDVHFCLLIHHEARLLCGETKATKSFNLQILYFHADCSILTCKRYVSIRRSRVVCNVFIYVLAYRETCFVAILCFDTNYKNIAQWWNNQPFVRFPSGNEANNGDVWWARQRHFSYNMGDLWNNVSLAAGVALNDLGIARASVPFMSCWSTRTSWREAI